MYRVVRTSEWLEHHGVKGMRWGHRKEYIRKGRRTRGSSQTPKSRRKLTDRQKRALKIGAAAVVTGLAIYGGYKLYKSGVITDVPKAVGDASAIFETVSNIGADGFKVLSKPETLEDTLRNANPNPNDPAKANNCTFACIAGHLRRNAQKDVIANSSGGEQQLLGGIIEDCFKGARVIDGSATTFGKSPEDAAGMLVRKFGQNASGAVAIQWKDYPGGHAFSWEIKDGNVSFMDYKHGRGDDLVRRYWRHINPNDSMTLARLDNAEPIPEKVKKYVSNR